jgi:hypothetical protein
MTRPDTLPRAIVREPGIRQRGLKRMLLGAVIAAVWGAVVLWGELSLMGPSLGLPGVLFLIGLVELVSGRSIAELSQRWDELKGWQRGILGLAIVAIATAVILVIAGTIVVVLLERSGP